ncbi:hypothetical protein [Virgibacillus kimchii]
MKNRLSFMSNDSGFFLPYVMLIITIVIIIVTASIQSYKNEIYITDRQVEHVIIESLFQLGWEMVKEEMPSLHLPDRVHYTFPAGTVEISIIPRERYNQLTFYITTNTHTKFSIITYMLLTEQSS